MPKPRHTHTIFIPIWQNTMNRWLLIIESPSIYHKIQSLFFGIAPPCIFIVLSSIFFGRSLFPYVFSLYPSENFSLIENQEARNISVWFCLCHDLMSFCCSQFKFCEKLYNFSVRSTLKHHFAENPHLPTIALYFINHWNITPK